MGVGAGTMFFLLGPLYINGFVGAELVIQAVVAPMVQCFWKLHYFHVLLLELVPVVGLWLGASACSSLSDRYGRRKVLIFGSTGIVFFSIMSGFATSFFGYAMFQLFVGVAHGASLAPSLTLIVEAVPNRWRVIALAGVSGFKAAGTLVAILLCFWLDELFGWRLIVIMTSFVFAPMICLLLLNEESPRYDVLAGEEERAWRTLAKIEKRNRWKLREMFQHSNDSSEEETSQQSPYSQEDEQPITEQPITEQPITPERRVSWRRSLARSIRPQNEEEKRQKVANKLHQRSKSWSGYISGLVTPSPGVTDKTELGPVEETDQEVPEIGTRSSTGAGGSSPAADGSFLAGGGLSPAADGSSPASSWSSSEGELTSSHSVSSVQVIIICPT